MTLAAEQAVCFEARNGEWLGRSTEGSTFVKESAQLGFAATQKSFRPTQDSCFIKEWSNI
jgi:hypothetical protein